jgi:Response regulator of the LytR/AlgR family
MIKVLILEDEEYNREFIKQILEGIPEITDFFDTSSGEAAVNWAQKNRPQIVFLDIELCNQEVNGLEVARMIRQFDNNVYIVFITGFSRYAVDAYDVHPYGYILKPIKISKLMDLVAEIVHNIKCPEQQKPGIFTIKLKNEIVHLNYSDIFFIEVQNHKSIIHTKDTFWELRRSLDELELILGADFLRVHRSFMVNLTKVKRTKETYDRSYEIEFWGCPKKALMSRYYYPKYKEHFK